MNKPLITIILPTFNRPEGLLKSIQGVLGQSYKNWELIVIDTSSSNDSYLVIKDFLTKDSIRYLKRASNSIPVGKLYNQGLQIANGEYIAFLTDESVYTPSALETLASSFNDTLDFVYGRIFTHDFYSGNAVVNSYSVKDWEPKKLKHINEVHLSSVLIKKRLLNKIGGFNEDIHRNFDLDLWNRVFYYGRTKRIYSIISDVAVGNKESLTFKYSNDFNIQDFYSKKYPLVGYWDQRASVSFNCLGACWSTQTGTIDALNAKKGPWIGVADKLDSDVMISDYIVPNGNLVYFKDPRVTENASLQAAAKAFSSPIFDLSSYPLVPVISEKQLSDLDKYYSYPKELRIGCLDMSDEAAVILDQTLQKLSPDFERISIVRHKKTPFIHKLTKQYLNVFDIPVVWDLNNLMELKQKNLTCILSLDTDYQNLENAFQMFLLSVLLSAPLISQPNIAFQNILEKDKHYLEYSIVDQVSNFLSALEILENRTSILAEARIVAKTTFMDSVIADNLTLFLNTLYEIRFSYNVGYSQLFSNTEFLLDGNTVQQSFICPQDNLVGVQVYLDIRSREYDLVCQLNDSGQLIDFVIPNYKLKNGANNLIFPNTLTNSSGKTYYVRIQSSGGFLGSIKSLGDVLGVGNLWVNDQIKKACLKFQTLHT